MTFHVGFTGTLFGMTPEQLVSVMREFGRINESKLINHHRHIVLHHGDAVGADSDAHTLGRMMGWEIHKHPALDMGDKSAHNVPFDFFSDPRPPLSRNRDIVRASSMIVAASGWDHEVLRSGEWATIRYAESYRIPVTVFAPNGKRIAVRRTKR